MAKERTETFWRNLALAGTMLGAGAGCRNDAPEKPEPPVAQVTAEESIAVLAENQVDNVQGEVRHEGDLVVNGNITAGAKLYINNGGLLVKGNVEDGALIEQRNGSSGNSVVIIGDGNSVNVSDDTTVISSGGTVTINGVVMTPPEGQKSVGSSSVSTRIEGGRVIINGIDRTAEMQKKSAAGGKTLSGIRIEGNVGTKANISSTESIHIDGGDVGEETRLEAGNSIYAGNIGEDASLKAGNNIDARNIGANASLKANNSIHASSAAQTAILKASNGVNIPGRSNGRRR